MRRVFVSHLINPGTSPDSLDDLITFVSRLLFKPFTCFGRVVDSAPSCPCQRRPARRRFESPGANSDDDANSDASSACSERSLGSRGGSGGAALLRQAEDVAEVLNRCASANWTERKEGLLGLQNLLRSQRELRWVRRSERAGLVTFIVKLREPEGAQVSQEV